jgi:predicted site-specific integrase-resolvase
MNEFVLPKVASKHFGVSINTLRQWEDAGIISCIKTKGNHRRYDISSYKNPNPRAILSFHPEENTEANSRTFTNSGTGEEKRATVCYCRVSSRKQTDDLRRQVEYLKSIYPSSEVITDVGSGLNFKRTGLLSLLERATKGSISQVVVAHKDRLCRFGFELILWIFSKCGVKITILEEDRTSADEELAKDILSIIHVFSCRANGKRKYKKREANNQEEETKQITRASDNEENV